MISSDKENASFWRPWELPPSSSKLSTTPQAFFLTPPPTPTTLPEPRTLTPQRYIKPLAPRQLNDSASTTGRRFAKPLTREEARQKTQPYVPKRTQQCNKWALSVFQLWVASRKQETPVESAGCPEDLLEAAYPTHTLDEWLSLFVLEARRGDGEYYPPLTVQNLLAALFRVYKANRGASVYSFMNKIERERYFPKLHNALDRHLRMLRAYGIGVERRTADVITPEMEQKLWSLGILGICTPESLLNAVFFYNGKSFALRGVKEQVELRFEQLVRMENPDRYTYYEYGSKNHSGGVGDKSYGKVVTVVDTVSASQISHVRILDEYFQPLPFTPTGSRPWYWSTPLGKNKLAQMVKQMFRRANIQGNFTNHSLRATCATQLFGAGIPEALVQKQTGHKSVESLRLYERVTEHQKRVVSNIIQPVVDPDSVYSPSENQPVFDPDSVYSPSELSIFDSIIV